MSSPSSIPDLLIHRAGTRKSWFNAIFSLFWPGETEDLIVSCTVHWAEMALHWPWRLSGLDSGCHCVLPAHTHALQFKIGHRVLAIRFYPHCDASKAELTMRSVWINAGQNISSPLLFLFLIGLKYSAVQISKSLFWLLVDFYQVCSHQPIRLLADVQWALFQELYICISQNKGCDKIPVPKDLLFVSRGCWVLRNVHSNTHLLNTCNVHIDYIVLENLHHFIIRTGIYSFYDGGVILGFGFWCSQPMGCGGTASPSKLISSVLLVPVPQAHARAIPSDAMHHGFSCPHFLPRCLQWAAVSE